MKYEVFRRVTLEQRYVVVADNPKDAEAMTCDISPEDEEELWGETMSVTAVSEGEDRGT